MPASLPPFAACLALLLPAAVHAAGVTVSVSDAAGRPLSGAVVTLHPLSGRATARPMPQVEIAQAQRQFTPRVSVVTVGTPVSFPNRDTVRHHVYSFSPAKTFELKLYTGEPAVPVVFDKPGIAVLGCNIHDAMAAWVVVVDTPHHAQTQAGSATLAHVPPGAYRLTTWHPGLPEGTPPVTSPLTIGAADASATVRLPVAP